MAGLAVFGAASLGSGLMLIVMRAVQGIGAAMVAPALLSLITTAARPTATTFRAR